MCTVLQELLVLILWQGRNIALTWYARQVTSMQLSNNKQETILRKRNEFLFSNDMMIDKERFLHSTFILNVKWPALIMNTNKIDMSLIGILLIMTLIEAHNKHSCCTEDQQISYDNVRNMSVHGGKRNYDFIDLLKTVQKIVSRVVRPRNKYTAGSKCLRKNAILENIELNVLSHLMRLIVIWMKMTR